MKILSGMHKGYRLPSPKGAHIRPTQEKVRAQIFNICQGDIEGAIVLDLFAGSGSLGFEALSRGAQKCIFVEKDRFQAELIKQVIAEWNVDAEVLCMDVLRAIEFLPKKNLQFSLCLLDPPYSQTSPKNGEVVLEAMIGLDTSSLVTPNCRVFLEDSFKSPVDGYTFQHLELIDQRRSGDTALRQYLYR